MGRVGGNGRDDMAGIEHLVAQAPVFATEYHGDILARLGRAFELVDSLA